jgi:glycosyltransferase involved in cell wall biosynthesis
MTEQQTRPTIGAVIVNFNYARYLPQAIESVLHQSVPFDAVVAVNDGSTDDSMTVLGRYRDALTVLDIPNGGQLGACRAGLAALDTEYVYFLDADDYAHPQLVETVRRRLPRSPVKVQFQLEGVSPDVESLESVFPTFPDHYDAARMRADNGSMGFYVCPPTSGNVYRCETLRALPLDAVDQRDFIDGPATLVLPHLGEIESIDAPLASYRVHGANHSQWSEPTVPLLAHEIEWFHRRWAQAATLMCDGDPARQLPAVGRSLYLVERELMAAALENSATTIRLAVRFLRALRPTNLHPRQKLMLAGWAVAVALPLAGPRRSLVRARRSPMNRSPRIRRLVRILLRGRLPDGRRSSPRVT